MAGKEERLNWVLLNRFVNDCLPVPALRVDGKVKKTGANKYSLTDSDGKSREFTIDPHDKSYIVLVGGQPTNPLDLKDGQDVAIVYQEDPGTKKYWDTPAAKNAYFLHWNRLAGGKGVEGKQRRRRGRGPHRDQARGGERPVLHRPGRLLQPGAEQEGLRGRHAERGPGNDAADRQGLGRGAARLHLQPEPPAVRLWTRW